MRIPEKHSQKSHKKGIGPVDHVRLGTKLQVEPSCPGGSSECWSNPSCGNTDTKHFHPDEMEVAMQSLWESSL